MHVHNELCDLKMTKAHFQHFLPELNAALNIQNSEGRDVLVFLLLEVKSLTLGLLFRS